MVLTLPKYIFLHNSLWRALNWRWVDLLNTEHCGNRFKYYPLSFIDSNGDLRKEKSFSRANSFDSITKTHPPLCCVITLNVAIAVMLPGFLSA